MQILITGASGMIGQALTARLRARGDTVIAVSRTPSAHAQDGLRWIGWDDLATAVEEADAVVHLAGAGIADARWSDARKQELTTSRVQTGATVRDAIRTATHPPQVLVSASAVGYYGNDPDATFDESAGPGEGFLADLCQAWESAVEDTGIRTVRARFGVVLSPEGGALKRLLLPFRWFVGGPVGRGRQWMSWVHIDDAVGTVLHAIDQDAVSGPINVTAPEPVTNKVFSQALGRTLGRPSLFRVPPLILRLQLGGAASVVTEGQRVLPVRTQQIGYTFQHPTIDAALTDLLTPG